MLEDGVSGWIKSVSGSLRPPDAFIYHADAPADGTDPRIGTGPGLTPTQTLRTFFPPPSVIAHFASSLARGTGLNVGI